MTRYFVLGNGNVLVGLDKEGEVRDLYFPYAGQENHVNGKVHRVGFWVDGVFRWFSSAGWKKKLRYQTESLVTDITAEHAALDIHVRCNDFVHHEKNIFLRKLTIQNQSKQKKEIKVFFHQNFEISEANVGDTVYYNPLVKALLHYKGKRYFLMNASCDNSGIDEYACGLVGEYGLESTYKDAEDGELSNNSIEHGSVDSTLGITLPINGEEQKELYYWICIGEKYSEVDELNQFVLKKKPEELLLQTKKYWQEWVNRAGFKYHKLSPQVIDLFKRSLLIISAHVDKRGAIIASSDSDMLYLRHDTYCYMWPRDGALVARSLDRAGYISMTKHFFKFCSEVLTEDGYLFHKYRPDGSLGSSWHPWLKHKHLQLPIQEDQIALVLDALWKHFLQHGGKQYIKELFRPFIRKMADFMASFLDEKTGLTKESYDLWEEKLGIHTFTCATVYAGLKAAAHFEKEFGSKRREKKLLQLAEQLKQSILQYLYDKETGCFYKSVFYDGNELKIDQTFDASSIYGIFQFGILEINDERLTRCVSLWQEKLFLKSKSGGSARYLGDHYYRIDNTVAGNPWFITTLWLAEYYINRANTEEELAPAIEIFEWCVSHALETGILAEQLHPQTGQPVSVAPLTWSHAGFVIAINKYLEKLDQLGICEMCNPPKIRENEKP